MGWYKWGKCTRRRIGVFLIILNIHLSLNLRVLSSYLFYVPYWIWSFKLQMSNCWNHFWSFNPSAFLIFLLQQIFLLKENINRGKKSWKSRGEKWNTTTLTFSPPITKDCFSWVNNFCIPLFIKTLNRWSSDRTSGTDVRLACLVRVKAENKVLSPMQTSFLAEVIFHPEPKADLTKKPFQISFKEAGSFM